MKSRHIVRKLKQKVPDTTGELVNTVYSKSSAILRERTTKISADY